MTFINRTATLYYDQYENLCSFLLNQNDLISVNFEKTTETSEKDVIVEDASLEYDVTVDADGKVYVFCQKNDGTLLLLTKKDGEWDRSILAGKSEIKIYNANILVTDENVHIFYCTPSKENEKVYRIYHHMFHENQWKTFQVEDIACKNLLNPFQLSVYGDRIILGYYHLLQHNEQIFMKTFHLENHEWGGREQLTYDNNYKLYLDMLYTKNEEFHIAFSQYIEGNLEIRHEKFRIRDGKPVKVAENVVSNLANCSYPTMVAFNKKLWIIWTEYDQIVSVFTNDSGSNWSLPYQWRESKEKLFMRYKFITNQQELKKTYRMNYSFGKEFPECTFMGFGSLDGAVEMPLKAKKKDSERKVSAMEVREDKIQESVNTPIKQEPVSMPIKQEEIPIDSVAVLEKRMTDLDERLTEIENYINRRRRGLFGHRG
ncbi:MAG: hypothetical protein ACOYVK_01735 [Bacillota bacterium]